MIVEVIGCTEERLLEQLALWCSETRAPMLAWFAVVRFIRSPEAAMFRTQWDISALDPDVAALFAGMETPGDGETRH